MEVRAKILNAALHLFATYGYDAVGVQTIAEAAEITKPTLYHYFGSKRGLFETLVREKSVDLLWIVGEAADYKGDITASIQNLIRVYFDYAQDNPVFYRMLLSMWFAPPSSEYSASVHDVLTQQQHMIERMFLQAARQLGNMHGRHQQFASSLKGMIDTYIGLSFQDKFRLDEPNVEYRLGHQFMHGIFS